MPKFEILQSTSDFITCQFSLSPTTVSGVIYDYAGDELLTLSSNYITIDSPVTISGICGASSSDDKKLLVTTSSGLSFSSDWRTRNSKKQWEDITIREQGLGYVEVDEPLTFDYGTGDVIEKCVATITLDPTATATIADNYRIRFEALLSDGTREWKDVLYDVVAHKTEQPITTKNLRKYCPQIARMEPSETEGTDFIELLQTSWDCVRSDIKTSNKRPDAIMDETQLRELHLSKFKQYLAENGILLMDNTSPLEVIEHYKKDYSEQFTKVLSKLEWIDEDKDLKPSTSETRFRQPRLKK